MAHCQLVPMIRLFLLSLFFVTPAVFAQCVEKQLMLCSDNGAWNQRYEWFAAFPRGCEPWHEQVPDGRTCMGWGNMQQPSTCSPAGTPSGGNGSYTSFSISSPSADLPSSVCIDGCKYDLGPLGSGVKSQTSSGQWVAGYHTPGRTSTGETCDPSTPDIPQADKDDQTCPPGYVREGGQCVKSHADQTQTDTRSTETQNPDGTKTTKETKTTTKCTQTQCTTTTTTTITNWHDGTPVGPSTTTTTTTTQPRGGASPAPGTPHPSGSGGGTGGGTGGTGGGTGGGLGGPNGSGTSNGSGYCEENPGSPLCGGDDHCEKYPNTLACLKKGDPGTLEATPVQNQDVNVSSITPRSGFGPSSASCPAGTTINVNGTSITIGFDMICQFADMIRPLVIGFAWLSAAFTFFGFARKD